MFFFESFARLSTNLANWMFAVVETLLEVLKCTFSTLIFFQIISIILFLVYKWFQLDDNTITFVSSHEVPYCIETDCFENMNSICFACYQLFFDFLMNNKTNNGKEKGKKSIEFIWNLLNIFWSVFSISVFRAMIDFSLVFLFSLHIIFCFAIFLKFQIKNFLISR